MQCGEARHKAKKLKEKIKKAQSPKTEKLCVSVISIFCPDSKPTSTTVLSKRRVSVQLRLHLDNMHRNGSYERVYPDCRRSDFNFACAAISGYHRQGL